MKLSVLESCNLSSARPPKRGFGAVTKGLFGGGGLSFMEGAGLSFVGGGGPIFMEGAGLSFVGGGGLSFVGGGGLSFVYHMPARVECSQVLSRSVLHEPSWPCSRCASEECVLQVLDAVLR